MDDRTGSVVDYVRSLDLADASGEHTVHGSLRGSADSFQAVHASRGPTQPSGESMKAGARSFAIGSQLCEFDESVPLPVRRAVGDCVLLAQLAANKAGAQSADVFAWYSKFGEVLQQVGWIGSEMEFSDHPVEDDSLDVHNAIIPVLTALLGPAVAAASVLVQALEGLSRINAGLPWITVFDRASVRSRVARFQLAFARGGGDRAEGQRSDGPPGDGPRGDGPITLRMAAMSLEAAQTINQLLFFRFGHSDARLQIAQGELTIDRERLERIGPAVAARVDPFLAANIAAIEI